MLSARSCCEGNNFIYCLHTCTGWQLHTKWANIVNIVYISFTLSPYFPNSALPMSLLSSLGVILLWNTFSFRPAIIIHFMNQNYGALSIKGQAMLYLPQMTGIFKTDSLLIHDMPNGRCQKIFLKAGTSLSHEKIIANVHWKRVF